ncbi:hypothetical protein WG66_010308 [Moniliophthora roreri]|nr:hypothetical protein WG66_010308 [Moniliophthora roreri]
MLTSDNLNHQTLKALSVTHAPLSFTRTSNARSLDSEESSLVNQGLGSVGYPVNVHGLSILINPRSEIRMHGKEWRLAARTHLPRNPGVSPAPVSISSNTSRNLAGVNGIHIPRY